MPGMRLVLVALAVATSGCITIHTIDLASGRPSLGSNCNVPMNKGGQVPEGWAEIGRVQIEGATSWSEDEFAAEFRSQACQMGADYVVVNGDNWFIEVSKLNSAPPAEPNSNRPSGVISRNGSPCGASP